MRQKHSELPRYTWDQATILSMFTSQSFQAVGYAPSTVRRWAKDGHVKPAGRGPNGHVLYRYDDVLAAAKRERGKSPGRPAKPHPCSSDKKIAQ